MVVRCSTAGAPATASLAAVSHGAGGVLGPFLEGVPAEECLKWLGEGAGPSDHNTELLGE